MKENHSTLKYDFSKRVVLVTGGTGALGRAITEAFIASNATLLSLSM
jgi:NAD(P)-dependent dehydrogenase (short-subunit alcohol dehydrogenase family)